MSAIISKNLLQIGPTFFVLYRFNLIIKVKYFQKNTIGKDNLHIVRLRSIIYISNYVRPWQLYYFCF